jgi:hypothetical protein
LRAVFLQFKPPEKSVSAGRTVLPRVFLIGRT